MFTEKGENRPTLKFIAALMLVSCASAQDPLLWGSLQPGSHRVGFRSTIEMDVSRQYDAAYQSDANEPQVRKARPILVDIWYPAQTSEPEKLRYREYFELPSSAGGEFSTRLSRFALQTASQDIRQGRKPGELSKAGQAAFDRLLATPTFAVRDAPPAAGRFPLVIYHAGAAGSYEENSALFEYLASHGYVVISSAYQSSDSSYIGNNRGGNSRSIRDMAFLIAFAGSLPYADREKVALMGHSAGAQTILQWLGEPDCPANAAVSLDTTVEYVGLKSHPALAKALGESEWRPHVPTLLFASSERHPNFDTWDEYLAFAPRYFASTKGLSHNDYLTHGAAFGTPAVRAGYDRVCILTREFLDAVLKANAELRAALLREPEIRLRVPALRMVPSARQVAAMFPSSGALQWDNVTQGMPAGLYRESLYQAGVLLVEERQFQAALAVQTLYAAKFPKSFFGEFLLGQVYAAQGRKDLAEKNLKLALKMLSSDKKMNPLMKSYYGSQVNGLLTRPSILKDSHEIK